MSVSDIYFFLKLFKMGYILSMASFISCLDFAPVITTFPLTKINKTNRGLIILYISPANNSGSYLDNKKS